MRSRCRAHTAIHTISTTRFRASATSFAGGFAIVKFPDASNGQHNGRTQVPLLLATIFAVLCLLAAGWLTRPAHAQVAVQNQGYMPFTDEPINYRTHPVNDPVAKLQKQLDRGEVTLTYESRQGYLRSVLGKLQIPASSQTLVFSKT